MGDGIVNEDGEYIRVRALAVYDDLTGRGPALYAALLGGTFQNFARWNGEEWEFIDASTSGKTYATSVHYDYASQVSMLLVGGETITSGTPIGAVRRFDPRTQLWHTFERGLNGDVNALQIIVEKDKKNPSLYVGGTFTSADGIALHNVGRWNNGEWTALESGTDGGVECFATFDANNDGDEELFVGGYFTHAGQKIVNKIAVWDGHTWSDVGGGVGVDAFPFDAVHSMVTHDDGSGNSLYVAGAFLTAGSVQAYNIARWDGTSWSALGDGLINRVRVLAVFDDGSGEGPCLYAGGEFSAAGDVGGSGLRPETIVTARRADPLRHIARWNGSEWSALGEGTNGFYVLSLAVYDDQLGAGPALYVGGYFSMAGSEIVNHIAKWDGEAWSSLRGGAPGLSQISALSVISLKPGGPPSLLVGGHFTQIGGVQAKSVALWDGVAWSQMPPGINEIGRYVSALAVHDDDTGAGPTVFAGGNFLNAPGGDSYLAKWQGCPILDIKGDISGDGRVNTIDILRMFAQWGSCGSPCPPNCNADIAGRGADEPDCVVDAHDLFVLLAHWTN